MERTLSFTIPKEDPDYPGDITQYKLLDNEIPISKNLTSSVNGHLYQVLYSIKIFVKHDSMQQFGEGECITTPIKIMERPIKIQNKDGQS